MEDVLDAVSVGYPNLVLTVTGWVDTIKVQAWSIKPLTVIFMPHSHQDPGMHVDCFRHIPILLVGIYRQ